jgi:hypothetical protein
VLPVTNVISGSGELAQLYQNKNMKQFLLVALFVLACLSGRAQNLANTTWLGTNPPSPNIWFRFGPDTLFYNFGSGGYTPLSVYTASAGVFTVFDILPASLCTDTGRYNYSIAGNTLTFTLISDNCSSRRNTMLNYTWFLLSTGMPSPTKLPAVSVIPSGSGTGTYQLIVNRPVNDAVVDVFDLTGKRVRSAIPAAPQITIDLGNLPPGIYTGVLHDRASRYAFRLVR